MLKATDIPGVDEDLARALIAFAVSQASCLDKLPAEDNEDLAEYRKRALSVLGRVARAAAKRGDLLVRSQRVGSAGVDYGLIGTAFGADDLAALQGVCASLCGSNAFGGTPQGSFPAPGLVAGVWPEAEAR